ncbi:hypothetical protein PA17_01694 [Pseudomonas aeruginosa]|nr:hypothetical protein [Pseudomonas aeruginosa]RCM97832.1 hypothetical protein PA17_01694 [Pseudomonas aeruginosa]
MKNLFAVIGFVVVAVKGFELYREYSEMKREREEGRRPGRAQ